MNPWAGPAQPISSALPAGPPDAGRGWSEGAPALATAGGGVQRPARDVPLSAVRAPVPPCRELCDASRAGCEPLMSQFQWPSSLRCSRFPARGSGAVCAAPVAGGSVSGQLAEAGGPQERSPSPPRRAGRSEADGVAHRLRPGGGIGSERPARQPGGHHRHGGAAWRLQADTLNMQQVNLRLEAWKLEMEIQLLRRCLAGN